VRPGRECDHNVERQPDHRDQGRRAAELGELLVDLVGGLLGALPDIVGGDILGGAENTADVVKSTGGGALDFLLRNVEGSMRGAE